MPHPPHEEPKSQRSVLQILGDRTGLASKVLLPDSDSEHGHSPVVDPGVSAAKLVPQGRGNYQLMGEIARGGMGVILKGHDTDLGRDVAVKVLDPELAKRPEVVQRFVEEAQIGGQLQHPGIVPVYELGLMADDRPYFTMKLIKGRTLAALFQQRKNTADNRGKLLAIFESVCQTMAYAHSKGVLHRDLKPANVMVGAFGEVQVVDWGLAKVLRRGGVADEKRAKETIHTVIETVRSGSGSSGSDSMVGSVMGTPAYMAPEQAQGEVEKLDERADVFSLGAILCELLTGKPPYVAAEGENVLPLAARAELDPARARIEACEADLALKRLCLDCLMPPRGARPANAEVVANAVHAYITSTEERAAKASIQAAEERRRRRLQAALGGTITVALVLGGGGFWWVNREREKRMDQTRTAVEAAYGESMEFGRSGKPADALQSARRALALAEQGEADAAMLERARTFVAQAEQASSVAESERTLHEKDEALCKQLIDLRLEQIKTLGNREREIELDAAFAKAFHDYGVDLEGDDLVPALKRIRERAIAEEVALALDDWGRLRRRVHGEKSEKAENLLYLAMDLDPEPGRLRLRQAIFDNDLAALLELAAPERLANLAPGSIWVLSSTLWDKFPEHRPDVYRMYDQAQHLYPGDFILQSVGGNIYQRAGRNEASMSCRTAALSLRPDDRVARLRVAESLLFLGRLTDAEGAARACVGSDPTSAEGHYLLAMCQQQLGDYAGALVNVTRSLELAQDPTRAPDLLALRYVGRLSKKADLVLAVAHPTMPEAIATYMWVLLENPNPDLLDPELVLRVLAEKSELVANADWRWVVEAVANVKLGRWADAQAALGEHFTPPATLMILTPSAFDFLRSLVCSKLGRADAAREIYARGMSTLDALTGGNPDAWERSDVMRWRRDAEAALEKK